MNGFTQFFYNLAHGLADKVYGGNVLEDAKNILTGTSIDAATNVMQSGYNIIVSVSAVLITLYFLLDLIEEMQRPHSQTPETIFKTLVKVVIAVELVIHGFDLFVTLRQVGDALTGSLVGIMSVSGGGASVADQIVPQGEKWYTYLGIWIELTLPFICSKIISVGINVTCYARLIELSIRTIFAPIAITNVFHDGLRSPGVRYIKKYIAVCLQSAVIICILALASLISLSAIQGNPGDDNFVWATLAINFSALIAILKSQSVANDIAGA